MFPFQSVKGSAWRPLPPAVVALAIAAFVPSTASAEEIRISVREILAHKESREIDPALNEKLISRLQKTLTYTGYKLIWDHHARLTPGESRYFQLSEGHALLLEPFRDENETKLRLTIYLETKKVFGPITIVPEKSPTVLGPRKLKAGDLLLYVSTYE
ncbi:MAG: hypothetical protein HYU36_22420 [Planctomycetes bacterium]|nr:hypothetical protein [Planctomycetota bacterium]